MGDDLRNLRLFSSYSPAQVVLRYAAMEDPQPPTEPEHNDFPAAIGFVDVSGFTALSEKLNKDHGRKGAELLNQCARAPPSPPRASPACMRHLKAIYLLRDSSGAAETPACGLAGTSTRTSRSSSTSSLCSG